MKSVVKGLLAGGLFALVASPVFASSVCPIPTSGSSNGYTVDSGYAADAAAAASNGGCTDLITFNADGSIVTTNPNANGFYDSGADDNLVGIVNNTNAAISAITLSSSVYDIFAFDSDGICGGSTGYTFTTNAGTNQSNASVCTGTDSTGYGGPGVTYSNISGNFESGIVNFATPIAANGGTAWFSLEAPVDLTQQVVNGGAPEPASMALIAGGLSGLYFIRRRRKA